MNKVQEQKPEEKTYRFFTLRVAYSKTGGKPNITPVSEYPNVYLAFQNKKQGEDVGILCNGEYYKVERCEDKAGGSR